MKSKCINLLIHLRNNLLRRLNSSETSHQMDNLLLRNNTVLRPTRSNNRSRDAQRNLLRDLFNNVINRRINEINENSEEVHSVRVLYDVLRSNIPVSQNNEDNLAIIEK